MDRLKQLLDDYSSIESECHKIQNEIQMKTADVTQKGLEVQTKANIEGNMKQEILSIEGDLLSLEESEKRLKNLIDTELSEKNSLYLNLVALEEEATKLKIDTDDIEFNFIMEREDMVKKYMELRHHTRNNLMNTCDI